MALDRITIFAKGNLDVHDTLHSLRVGGAVVWNGINEVLRERTPAAIARVRHETWTRSDALLAADGGIPRALAGRDLALGPYPVASQFSRAVFETDADAYVLTIQPSSWRRTAVMVLSIPPDMATSALPCLDKLECYGC